MPIDVSDRSDMASENLLWPSESLNTYELVRGMASRVFNGCGAVCDDVNCIFGGARFVSRLPAFILIFCRCMHITIVHEQRHNSHTHINENK